MTDGKQGAVEWLREIAQRKCNCHEVVRMFGFACGESPCTECIPRLVGAIAQRVEKERALPDGVEWPRFEDGELVKVGDEAEYGGKAWEVDAICFDGEEWSMALNRNLDLSYLSGSYGERLKRPTPKVLDADGAPIEVGDTVYCDGDPEQLTVDSFDDPGCVYLTLDKDPNSMLYTVEPSRLSHERPDSWERIEEDAYHLVMSEYLETPEKDVRDIVRRAKALAMDGACLCEAEDASGYLAALADIVEGGSDGDL